MNACLVLGLSSQSWADNVAEVLRCKCRPLAPGPYNVTVSKEGYGSVRAEVVIPEDGSGVEHDFVLPCKSCGTVQQDSAEADVKVRYTSPEMF